MSTIEITDLTKQFGDVYAVKNVNFEVNEGEVFGFLGPNGAGKSTTINLLLDFIRPTSSSIDVFGMDTQTQPRAIKRKVGILPEDFAFDDPLTGREYLKWTIESKTASDDLDTLLDLVGLTTDADRLASDYSKGMQQRLSFAMALVGDPDLLILDEPSTGLDPNGIQQMREIVRARAANGTTVFFSSHVLSEVEAVCDRIGVMNDGELIAVDTIDGLRQNFDGNATIRLKCATPPSNIDIDSIDGVVETTVDNRTLSVTCRYPRMKVDVVTAVATQAQIVDILSESVSLESLFNELTKGGRDSDGQTDRTIASEVSQ